MKTSDIEQFIVKNKMEISLVPMRAKASQKICLYESPCFLTLKITRPESPMIDLKNRQSVDVRDLMTSTTLASDRSFQDYTSKVSSDCSPVSIKRSANPEKGNVFGFTTSDIVRQMRIRLLNGVVSNHQYENVFNFGASNTKVQLSDRVSLEEDTKESEYLGDPDTILHVYDEGFERPQKSFDYLQTLAADIRGTEHLPNNIDEDVHEYLRTIYENRREDLEVHIETGPHDKSPESSTLKIDILRFNEIPLSRRTRSEIPDQLDEELDQFMKAFSLYKKMQIKPKKTKSPRKKKLVKVKKSRSPRKVLPKLSI